MTLKSTLVVSLFLITVASFAANDETRDYVPDERTAIRIAEAVLIPIYGEKHVIRERPFRANLDDGVWTVKGHFPRSKDKNVLTVGGSMTVLIDKKSGCIKEVYHSK